jgi:segregation and condensation protein B
MTENMNEADPKTENENEPETAGEANASAPAEASEQAGEETPPAPAEPVEIDAHHLRLLEAVLFSATDPLAEKDIAERLPDGAPVAALLASLSESYANRGVNLAMAGGKWFFRTAEDLSEELRVHMTVARKLSRAAMETLAIVAYHQPITRAEIEEIRGVGLSRGTLDSLLEAGWIGPRGRRRTAGRPVTWGTTQGFLTTFGLAAIDDLPGLDDLRSAGLLDKRPAIQITDVQNAGAEEEEEEDSLADDDELLDMDLSGDADADTGDDAAEQGIEPDATDTDPDAPRN